MEKLISIIVPVFKVEKELDRCVQSLLKQTYKNIEILLVEDGSPDSCPEMCDAYAQKDMRIKVIHKENGGLSDARNAGLLQAAGDYILYVDSDDYIDLDSCERFIRAMLEDNVDIVVGNAIMHKRNGNEMMMHLATPSGKVYASNEFIIRSISAHQWYAAAWLNMYRREFLIDNNLFYKKGIYFEDMQMLPRVFLAAKKISCMDGTFYHYIVRNNSIMTSQKTSKKEKDSIQNLVEWKEYFDGINDKKLKKSLYGMLLKCYLHECRVYGITEWKIPGIDGKFAMQYGLNLKEKLKGMFFGVFPEKYIQL